MKLSLLEYIYQNGFLDDPNALKKLSIPFYS